MLLQLRISESNQSRREKKSQLNGDESSTHINCNIIWYVFFTITTTTAYFWFSFLKSLFFECFIYRLFQFFFPFVWFLKKKLFAYIICLCIFSVLADIREEAKKKQKKIKKLSEKVRKSSFIRSTALNTVRWNNENDDVMRRLAHIATQGKK